jgi:hypothetical protein
MPFEHHVCVQNTVVTEFDIFTNDTKRTDTDIVAQSRER